MQPSKEWHRISGKLKDSFELKAGDKIGILINGMGATPLMEQYVFTQTMWLESTRQQVWKLCRSGAS